MAALVVVLALAVWSAWRDREMDFIHRVAVGAHAAEFTEAAFDQLIPVLVKDGFATVAHGGNTTAFERRYVQAWTVWAAVLLFPVGLVALLFRGRESITVVSGERIFEVQGRCGKPMADFVIAVADDIAAEFAGGIAG